MPTGNYLPEGDELPFIEAIRDEYFEDTPRLAFADFLSERGDPRGDFVRAQVKASRFEWTGKTTSEDGYAANRLWGIHGGAWCGPLWDVSQSVDTDRGMLVIRGTPEELATHEPRVEMMVWADSIRVNGVRGGMRDLEKVLDTNRVCAIEFGAWTNAEHELQTRFINWLAKRSGTNRRKALPSRLVSLDFNRPNSGGTEQLLRLAQVPVEVLHQIRYIRLLNAYWPEGYGKGQQSEYEESLFLREYLTEIGWTGTYVTKT